jgi:glutamyl-tRNA reductase
VIGTGPAGVSVGRALRGAHVGALTFVSRAPDRRREAVLGLGAGVEPFDRLGALLESADLVVAARGSAGFVVDEVEAREAARARGGRRLLIVDLAVPADVDPAVADVKGIELVGLDDVREVVDRHLSRRREELAPAEAIIDEIVAEHDGSAHPTESVIDELRRAIEETRAREVARWLERRNVAGAPTRDELDRLTRSLVNKLLHDPMVRLRAAAPDSEAGRALLRAVSELFGLSARAGEPLSRSSG